MLINCDICNKEFKITPSRLQKARSHTCSIGCQHKVLSKIFTNKIEVKCEQCGRTFKLKPSYIRNRKHLTCSAACSNRIKAKFYKGQLNPKALGLSEIEKFFWDRTRIIQRRASAKNFTCDIDYRFLMSLYEKQNGLCYYTNIPMRLPTKGNGRPTFDALSVDKINPNKGYTRDNVVLCINCINMMKSEHSLEDIEKVFAAIVAKRSTGV